MKSHYQKKDSLKTLGTKHINYNTVEPLKLSRDHPKGHVKGSLSKELYRGMVSDERELII